MSRYYRAVPVDARALYAEGDAQVDAGPAGVRLPAVTAAGVARDGQDPLEGTLPLQGLLLGLAARVQAPRGRGRPPVQLLETSGKKRIRSSVHAVHVVSSVEKIDIFDVLL